MSKDNPQEIDVNLTLVDINLIYNPRFHLIDLISTRRRPFASTARNPPRPPNSFFLMKNCLLLELKHNGYRLTMPNLCKMARSIWKDIPQDVKNKYDDLATQAQILHHRIYPNYRFEPKKRTRFKPFVPPNNHGMSAFSSVTSVATSPSLSSSSSPSPTPMTPPPEEVYLPIFPDNDFAGIYNFHDGELNYYNYINPDYFYYHS